MTTHIGTTIQAFRKKANLTQEALAQRANIAYSTLTKIERGAIKDPSIKTMIAIAQAMEITVDAIITGHEQSNRAQQTKKSDGIQFVYCDVNGVLVRFFQRAFVSLAEKTRRDIGQVETAFWHYNASVNKGEMTTDQFNKAVAKKLRVPSIDWQSEYMDGIEKVTAMQDCLREIVKDTNVGLLTNTFPDFIRPMIASGLLPDIDYSVIVDSSEVGAIKPETEIYTISEKLSGYSGENILFIDDSRTNLMEAEKLGWKVLWFDDYRPEESVKRIIDTLNPSKET